MKATISVGGRFHAFYLAKSLQDAGYLHQLVTSYPTFEVEKYGIDGSKVTSIITKEIIERGWKKLTGRFPSNIFTSNWYDKCAALQIPLDSDIYIIWSGFALHTIRKIRKHNPKAIIVLERGSAHIQTQANLLFDISQKHIIEQAIIDKEMKEYEATDIISTISLFAKRTFEDKGISTHQLFVNPMGVHLQEFGLINRVERNNHALTVGYVGAMSSQKNVRGLIAAVQKIYETNKAIRLLLVGGIDNESFDKIWLDKEFITYILPVPQKELINYYKEMDIFVLNSVQDGFGIVLLQAMATGLPVIATTNTGGLDVIKEGENGFIIPIKDDNALAEKISYFCNNRQKCIEMGEKAYQTTKSGFTWDDYGRRYIAFLENLKK